MNRLADEWQRLIRACRGMDAQTAVVLSLAALLVILQMNLGDREVFQRLFGHLFEEPTRGLLAWGWWFGMQGLLGFVVPVLVLRFVFHRSASEIGLGAGDWQFALPLTALYLAAVVVGTWFLSSGSGFLARYPHYHPAARDWTILLIYEGLFLFYWLGWEYLWRGFVLFGTAHRFGAMAIFVQAMPFAILHYNKPMPEALLSIVGGVALGALVWRMRSFWIAVPIHAAQMIILDVWCTLRVRSGVRGVGFDSLGEIWRHFVG